MPATILIVDDEPANRALLGAVLSRHHSVVEAENGVEALEVLAKTPVDLVILDVMMPELDGFQTCRAIKAKQGERYLPVALLTALDGQDDRNESLAAGADEFLTKPVDIRELDLRVRSLLRLREQEIKIREQLAELQDLTHLKDDLFSLIVHDLKNPLAGVVGFLELLQTQLGDPALAKAKKNADQAIDAARKLQALIEEVTDVRSLETPELKVDRERVDLGTLLRDAASTLEGAARARQVAIVVQAEPEIDLDLDRSLVRRAVENLIAHSVRFSPKGEPVAVRGRRVGSRVEIEVSDRGPHLTDSQKVEVFEKFAAVEARRANSKRRGFGLGLYLVKLAATAHGGEALVRDVEGGGSLFVISLPERAPS